MELFNVKKIYTIGTEKIYALDGVNISLNEKNVFYLITGHSGSGKTTLIQILGLLDKATEGKFILAGQNANELNENEMADLRKNKIGFIFQSYNLNPYLKAYENVMLPMYINKSIDKNDRKKIAIELLERVGLKNRVNHYPKELSGGEQQRVAIARALANNPDIILADEPTGNLDANIGKEILELLQAISKQGKCVIMVSHDENAKKYADYIYEMSSGKIVELSYESN